MNKVITISLMLILSACSSDDVETANFGSDYYKSDYQLVNATNLELDFYMANSELDGDERDPFKDKYKVAHVTKEEGTKQIRHEHNAERKVNFYVHAPYANKAGYRETHKVKRDRHYQWLAWMSGEALSHSLFEKYESNREGYIRVRLFATDTALQANNSGQTLTLTIGKVSEFISVDQCNGGLQVNGMPINLCDASFGRSYLLVVGDEGRISLALQ
ncbi:hypothetical protein KJY73_12135 [Bowmanella sp. Y26]|uniref:hypothetical protein n=1 Tax=Bowmanella yangjiangensis TaxID=2811230 RepID=UPI001BDCA994|nr:hypothetical protein [Bowmanella yangjiangensis]MBT1064330.1 hypothetical protein [Bowmanella yangjiangensis]